jgi:hypothetical protein
VYSEVLSPRSLTWAEVDPARRPSDLGDVPVVVRGLDAVAAFPTPPTEAGEPARNRWVFEVADPWVDSMAGGLVDHYGRWVSGWRWAIGEGDYDGGPIRSWCCASHSVTSRDATLAAIAAAVVEWQGWLTELSERFARFLPLPTDPGTALDTWERAVGHLTTVVVERTDYESGWYDHCAQVLGWFLEAAGVPGGDHQRMVADAIGGRFHSSVEPSTVDIREVATTLAETVVRRAPD